MSRISLSPSDIEAFLTVAETGSFSRAGMALGLSQPAVSARISNLERTLGVSLFHRTTRRVTITDSGERLRIRLDRAIIELRGLLEELRDEASLRRGRVTVGASPTVAAGFLAGVIATFHVVHPEIEIVLHDDFYGRALDRILRGEVDLAVIPFEPEGDVFTFERLFTDRFLLAVSSGHTWATRKTVTLSEVASVPLVTMPPQSAAWGTIKRAFEAAGLTFNPALCTRNTLTTIALVRAGFGVAFATELLMRTFPVGGLALLEVEDGELGRTVGIITRKDRMLPPATEALCAALRSAAEGLHPDTSSSTSAVGDERKMPAQ